MYGTEVSAPESYWGNEGHFLLGGGDESNLKDSDIFFGFGGVRSFGGEETYFLRNGGFIE